MKKCIIYVFSGTGNTRLIADLYKKYLTDYETVIYNIRSSNGIFNEYPDPSSCDLIGFGFPVHGFNAPLIMWQFCKQLPSVNNINSFIFSSSGEGLGVNDYAYQKFAGNLRKKGYVFLSARRYVMPYNMIFRHSPEMVKTEYIYADAGVRLNCKEVTEGKKEKIHICSPLSFFVPIVRILWGYAKVQSPFMNVNMEKCIKCNKCVHACPYGNIKFDDEKNKFKFGTNCVLCVACSFGCPKDAISIGLLNGWRVNGSYNILKTAADKTIEYPYFGDSLKGFKRFLYYRYFRKMDKMLEKGGIQLNPDCVL